MEPKFYKTGSQKCVPVVALLGQTKRNTGISLTTLTCKYNYFIFQIYACMMVFFLSNAIEGQLLSTGAFEISFNGERQ